MWRAMRSPQPGADHGEATSSSAGVGSSGRRDHSSTARMSRAAKAAACKYAFSKSRAESRKKAPLFTSMSLPVAATRAAALRSATSLRSQPATGDHRARCAAGARRSGSRANTGPRRSRASALNSYRSALVDVARAGPGCCRRIGTSALKVLPSPGGATRRRDASQLGQSLIPPG